jgi:hypothetical protein
VTQNPDHLGRVDVGAAPRSIVLSTIALAFAATMALVASATHAHATAREISASSYGFADSLLPNTGLERLQTLSSFSGVETHGCSVHCGPAFGTYGVRRSELLTSKTADLSTRKTTDSAGHPMGLGGMVVVERLEPDASDSLLTNWVVVSERTIDENGSHSWSLLSGAPSNTPWLPNDLYRFEGFSFSMDLLADAPATPEASTWMMSSSASQASARPGIGTPGLGARSNFPRGSLRDDLQSAPPRISSDRADAGVDPKSPQQRHRDPGRRSGIDERRKRRIDP